MNSFHKIYLIVFIFLIITIILSYFIDWTITRNWFNSMTVMCLFFMSGLIGGRMLTEKEMRE